MTTFDSLVNTLKKPEKKEPVETGNAIIHVDAPDFRACYVFCDGEDISNTCFFADEAAGVAYCFYDLSEIDTSGRIKAASHRMIQAFPEDMFAPHVRVPDDAMIIRKRTGKIEIIEDIKRRGDVLR